jgi:hypothetical protein
MTKAIEQKKSGLVVGNAGLGIRGGVPGSVRHQVHDGDTVNVRALGNFGIRFLGIDAAEISFMLPGERKFTGLYDGKWEIFLSNPFAEELVSFDPPLTPELRNYLQTRVGPGAAMNQHTHAEAAEDILEEEILGDLKVLGQNEENF